LLQAKEGYIPAKIIQEFINTGAFMKLIKAKEKNFQRIHEVKQQFKLKPMRTPIPKSNQVDKKR